MTEAPESSAVSSDRPTSAGIYDVYLGGANHSVVERETAAKLRELLPDVEAMAWANRSFHQRVTRWLAEQGVRQFIDLGAGLPTQDNTHQVAQRVAAEAKVVYVDIDPRTAAAGRGLLADSANAAVVMADLCEPERVLGSREVRELIDFEQPVGLICTAVLHFIGDEKDPFGVIRTYMDALPSGSYLALTHITADKQPSGPVKAISGIYRGAGEMIYFRSRELVDLFFAGLDLEPPYENADPKLTFMGIWGCEDPEEADDDVGRWAYAGVARKP
ncbi:MAG: hypothetical protein GEV07_15290 [Streptosporangiales bacterium]|nr:hypothetical protein [Streptosporangiales bacterium]